MVLMASPVNNSHFLIRVELYGVKCPYFESAVTFLISCTVFVLYAF